MRYLQENTANSCQACNCIFSHSQDPAHKKAASRCMLILWSSLLTRFLYKISLFVFRCMCLYAHMHAPIQRLDGVESSGAGVAGGSELLSVCNSGIQDDPLKEQQVPLATEPSLQPVSSHVVLACHHSRVSFSKESWATQCSKKKNFEHF